MGYHHQGHFYSAYRDENSAGLTNFTKGESRIQLEKSFQRKGKRGKEVVIDRKIVLKSKAGDKVLEECVTETNDASVIWRIQNLLFDY